MPTNLQFKNRVTAGRFLANKLLPYKSEKPLIFALPRGGVPVGFEVALKLNALLDTIVARKIGAPSSPEFGVGAIAPPNVIILDQESVRSVGLTEQDLKFVIEQEKKEMQRRAALYKSGQYCKGGLANTVIIVDDGLCTGVTARAAIESVRINYSPKKIIFAAPICARDTTQLLADLVEDVVCVKTPDNLMALGYWYQEFNQVSDEEVVDYLEKANKKRKTANAV